MNSDQIRIGVETTAHRTKTGDTVTLGDWRVTFSNNGVDLKGLTFTVIDCAHGKRILEGLWIDGVVQPTADIGPLALGETKSFGYELLSPVDRRELETYPSTFCSGHFRLKVRAETPAKQVREFATPEVDFRNKPAPGRAKCRCGQFAEVGTLALAEVRSDSDTPIVAVCAACGESVRSRFRWTEELGE